jgi:hypothetical protein
LPFCGFQYWEDFHWSGKQGRTTIFVGQFFGVDFGYLVSMVLIGIAQPVYRLTKKVHGSF